MGRKAGLSDEKLRAVRDDDMTPFNDTERLVIELADAMAETPGFPRITRMPRFTGGSAGLGSRDVRAGDFIAIMDNMLGKNPRYYFSLGIKHSTALPITNDPDVLVAELFRVQ